MTHQQVHDKAWEWMKKATEDLRDIAKDAEKASKVGKLEDAVEMKRVKKQALDGVIAVSKIFGKVVQAAYSYDRTAAGSSSALQTIRKNFVSVEDAEKSVSKVISILARMTGMSSVTGPLDEAADHLKKAAELINKADKRLTDIQNG